MTESELIARWLMPLSFDARVGYRFTLPGATGADVVHGEVTEVAVPQRLAARWCGGPIDAIARWTLHQVPRGTRLQFELSGVDDPRANAAGVRILAAAENSYGIRLPILLNEMASDA